MNFNEGISCDFFQHKSWVDVTPPWTLVITKLLS